MDKRWRHAFKRLLPRKDWQGKWRMGYWWHDEDKWLYVWSNLRMRLRYIWPYQNARPVSSRWSGHFAQYWKSI